MTTDLPNKASGRYRLNLVLLIVWIVLTTLWFYTHLYDYVVGSLLLGGLAGLYVAWKLVQSLVGWTSSDDETRSRLRRTLDRPSVTLVTAAALAVVVGLFLTTSSIYIVHKGLVLTGHTVEVRRGEESLIGPDEIHAGKSVTGRPFFFGGRREVEVRILDPPGYRSVTRVVRPWSALRLLVPTDFEILTAVRLVPGLDLFPKLPPRSSNPTTTFSLRLKIGEVEDRLDDIRRDATIYVGASEQFVAALDSEDLDPPLEEYYSRNGLSRAEYEPLLNVWNSAPPRHLGSTALRGDEHLQIEVRQDGSNEAIVSVEVDIGTLAGDRLKTVMVEDSP